MKLNRIFLLVSCVALLPQMASAMATVPSTEDGRRDRWVELQQEIQRLQQQLPTAQAAFAKLGGKEVPDIHPEDIQKDIREKQSESDGIALIAERYEDEWVWGKERLLQGPVARVVSVVKDAVGLPASAPATPAVPAAHPSVSNGNGDHPPQSDWAGAGQPPPTPSTPFWTPERRTFAKIAGIVVALGALYQKAPQWMKNRVKTILKQHGKTLADVTPAEQDLLISASYARFNPAGSFFFQEAVLDMPEGEEFREELWPVLNHVYYGKKRVTSKQKKELRVLYDEAQELMVD